jgi:hypothetical protein
MKRDVSYSDSFVYTSDTLLEPLSIVKTTPPPPVYLDKCVLFLLKGSLHIFFISAFETVFYFLYVSKSENDGILNTVNTYYTPLIQSCDSWSNKTRELLFEFVIHNIDKQSIDTKGTLALQNREETNRSLLAWSIGYSGMCVGVFGVTLGTVYFKKITLNWFHLLSEHLSFVVLLGLYEYFFFRTIIYNYQTLSTDELNQYIVDGVFHCLEN